MAGAGGIRAGRAFVELYADDSRLVRGLRSAQQKLAAFGAAVRGIGSQLALLGAGILAPLGVAAHVFADTGSQLADMSARTGVSVEALSELGYAAQQSGSSLEDVEKSVRTMQRTITAAVAGSDQAATALGRLGLSAEQLAGLNPAQQFSAIATALQDIPDPTTRAATAMSVLGKSGTSLLPMIADLTALRQEARRLGVVMTGGQAQAADALGDAFDRVRATLRAVAIAVGTALAPVLIDLAGRVTGFLIGLRAWIAANQGLVVTVLGVGGVIAGVGAALIALGLAVAGLSAGIGALASVVTATGSVLAGFGTLLGALLTPIGAVVAGVVTLGSVVATQTQSGRQALGLLGQGFDTLRADAVDAWTGIADALAAGNISLAAQVVWTTLKLEWERGTAFLLNVWDAGVAGFAKLFTHAWFGIQDVFWNVVDGIADAWDWVIGGITQMWNSAVGAIAGKLAELLELVGLVDEGLSFQVEEETRQTIVADDARRSERMQARVQGGADRGEERQAILDGIDANLVDQVMGRDAGVEAARAELTAAMAEARRSRTAVERRVQSPGAAPAPGAALPDLDALRASLEQLPATLSAEAAKLDVSGSFTAAAIGQLGVGDTANERVAKAGEATAENTRRILQAIEDGDGLVFG